MTNVFCNLSPHCMGDRTLQLKSKIVWVRVSEMPSPGQNSDGQKTAL